MPPVIPLVLCVCFIAAAFVWEHAVIPLILCVCFIAAAFVWEHRRRPEVSPALWVPQIWVLISASRPVYLWIYPDPVIPQEIDYLSGNPVDRAILSVLLAIGVMVLLRRKVDWTATFKKNIWICLLFGLMAVSIAWSDFPAVSFKRWVRSAGDFTMVLIVLSDRKPVEAIKTLILRIAFILFPLSILFIKYFPQLGVAYTDDGLSKMWVGVTTHKNELGALVLICGIFIVWNLMGSWRARKIQCLQIPLILMVFWLLRGSTTSDSKTSVLIFFLGSGMLIFLNLLRKKSPQVGRMFLGCALVFFFADVVSKELAGASLYELIVRASGRDATLTGRTDLWKELMAIATKTPFLGRGYGSFWIGNLHHLWEKFNWRPTQGHNGYIDVFLELGLAGLSLLTLAILHAYKGILQQLQDDFRYASLRLVFFLIILMHNYTESSFLRGSSFLWFIFLLFAVYPPVKKENTNAIAFQRHPRGKTYEIKRQRIGS